MLLVLIDAFTGSRPKGVRVIQHVVPRQEIALGQGTPPDACFCQTRREMDVSQDFRLHREAILRVPD